MLFASLHFLKKKKSVISRPRDCDFGSCLVCIVWFKQRHLTFLNILHLSSKQLCYIHYNLCSWSRGWNTSATVELLHTFPIYVYLKICVIIIYMIVISYDALILLSLAFRKWRLWKNFLVGWIQGWFPYKQLSHKPSIHFESISVSVRKLELCKPY